MINRPDLLAAILLVAFLAFPAAAAPPDGYTLDTEFILGADAQIITVNGTHSPDTSHSYVEGNTRWDRVVIGPVEQIQAGSSWSIIVTDRPESGGLFRLYPISAQQDESGVVHGTLKYGSWNVADATYVWQTLWGPGIDEPKVVERNIQIYIENWYIPPELDLHGTVVLQFVSPDWDAICFGTDTDTYAGVNVIYYSHTDIAPGPADSAWRLGIGASGYVESYDDEFLYYAIVPPGTGYSGMPDVSAGIPIAPVINTVKVWTLDEPITGRYCTIEFDRHNFLTRNRVYDVDDNILWESTGHENVRTPVFSPTQPPAKVGVLDPSNPNDEHIMSLIAPDDPDDPGDPSRVMVHIIAQDARNENLLLDAAVEVRDQYDAVVAAGTTSPEGWMVFEYDLPDTLTDEDFDRYYTVSVSLPGWTQKVTNFKFYPAFIPRSGDWIRVEMLPDTDGPADPEKTYIMFFVRDIHANPLERASIEIAGQYWHTNSAGHVAVEVPKNSTTAYTVRKTGHVSISGSAAVGAEGSYVVNIALGPALPDRTPGPGDDPGATPPPRDTRTNEEKGKAVIDLIADNAELIATLAILAAVMGLINLIMPGRRRR